MTRLRLLLLALLLAGCPSTGPLGDDDDAVDDDDAADDDDAVDDDDSVDPQACGEVLDWDADWTALTAGVSTIESGGAQPDNLLLHGPSTFPVVQDEEGRTFVAAGHLGDGRAVVFAHEAYFGGLLEGSDVGTLVDNAVDWVRDGGASIAVAPGTFPDLVSRLEGAGLTVAEVAPLDLDDSVDAYVFSAYPGPSAAELTAVREYLEGGGGLVLGGQAWWYTYSTGEPASTFAGNVMVGELGIWFAGQGAVSAGSDTVSSSPPEPLEHGHAALAALLAHLTGGPTLSQAELVTAVGAAGTGVSELPLGTDYFRCARAVAQAVGPFSITSDTPLVRADRPLEELVVRLDVREGRDLPAEELWAHPASTDFPGAVAAEAQRVSVSVTIDGTHDGIDPQLIYSGSQAAAWRSTGLYAAPGDLLTVTVDPLDAGQGLEVQIGAHSDSLWGKDTWERYPYILRRDALETTTTTTASLWGGPVYIRVPVGLALGSVDVTIEGAVAMPRFVRGEHSDDDWEQMKGWAGPWAELEANSYVITVPSADVQTLTDPEALTAFWDAVLDADAWLYGIPAARPRAERFVTDRQISAGWMHSGYPMMAHLASVEEVTSLTSLTTSGAWGPFHELGHNHQHRDFVLPGTTEGNVNLWSVYASEEVAGVSRDVAHPAVAPSSRAQTVSDYLATGPDFANWSVWTALETYLQLQEGFGWEPYPELFDLYRSLDSTGHPGTDQERIDLFVQSYADIVEHDLGPFFLAWGFPVSQGVLDDIAQYPAWDEDPMNP